MLGVGEGGFLLHSDEFLLADPVERQRQRFWFCNENVHVLLTLRDRNSVTFCRGVTEGYHSGVFPWPWSPPSPVYPWGFQWFDQTETVVALHFLEVEEIQAPGKPRRLVERLQGCPPLL